MINEKTEMESKRLKLDESRTASFANGQNQPNSPPRIFAVDRPPSIIRQSPSQLQMSQFNIQP